MSTLPSDQFGEWATEGNALSPLPHTHGQHLAHDECLGHSCRVCPTMSIYFVDNFVLDGHTCLGNNKSDRDLHKKKYESLGLTRKSALSLSLFVSQANFCFVNLEDGKGRSSMADQQSPVPSAIGIASSSRCWCDLASAGGEELPVGGGTSITIWARSVHRPDKQGKRPGPKRRKASNTKLFL